MATRVRAGSESRPQVNPLPLLLLAAVVTVLGATGVLPRWPGLPHLVALPPLDLAADLRVLLTLAPSYPLFVLGLAGALAVRVVVLAFLLGGPSRARLAFAARFYGAVLLPLLVVAQLDFTAHAALYARVFWPALGVLALVFLLTAALPWQGTVRLRSAAARAARQGLRARLVVAYAAALTLVGVVADAGPAASVLAVPVSAGLTVLAVRQLAGPPPDHPRRHLAVLVVGTVLAATLLVTTRGTDPGPEPAGRTGSLLLMSGVSSASGEGAIFETDVEALGFRCDQTYYYSYAGPGDGQPRGRATCPIRTGAPYGPFDTLRPFDEQVEAFVAQVRELPAPVTVAGHSQAAWLAWAATASGEVPSVDRLVLVGPFPDNAVGYPPRGEDGTGRVGGDLFRLLLPIADALDFDFDPDAPLPRELLATPNAASEVFGRPLPPDVRALGVTSTADLPLLPRGWRLPGAELACPIREAHPYLPITPGYYRAVNRFLNGLDPEPCSVWRLWPGPLTHHVAVPPVWA